MNQREMVLTHIITILLLLTGIISFNEATLQEDSNSLNQLETTCPKRPLSPRLSLERKCSRKCSSDKLCKGKRKQCLCDGECGLSCINPNLRCHYLIDVPNGWVMPPHDYKFGSVARFGCNPGYKLFGPDERSCQGNRKWSGQQPRCVPNVKCGPPAEVPYAKHDGESKEEFELDTMIKYDCIIGYYRYNTKGLARAKCLLYNNTARWFGPDIRCSPRACGNPGEILNGIREGDLFIYGHQVEYKCAAGFTLVGSAIRKCLATGQWSGTAEPPSCKPVLCPKPPDPKHGKLVGTSLAYQSRITYQCNKGHRLIGPDQRVCQADKTWSGQEPFCEEIRCPSLGPLWNGYLDGTETSYGSLVIFRCLEGMTFIGEAPSATCQRDGLWSHPLPQCLAPCRVPAIENGHIKRHNASEYVHHQEMVEIVCHTNHEVENSRYPSCNNGSWTHVARCIPIRCKSWPPAVKNGIVRFQKTEHDTEARYECDPGYGLRGNKKVRCLFGQWTGATPTCIEKHCEHAFDVFGPIDHGRIMLEGSMGVYEYTEYIRHLTEGRRIFYECEKGFVLIDYCTHPAETFGPITHGRIMLEGSMGIYEYTFYIRAIGEGRVIFFECDKGYFLAGPPKSTCVDGQWKPSAKPRCLSKTHPVLEDRIIWDRRRKRSVNKNPLLRKRLYRNRTSLQSKEVATTNHNDIAETSEVALLEDSQYKRPKIQAGQMSASSNASTTAGKQRLQHQKSSKESSKRRPKKPLNNKASSCKALADTRMFRVSYITAQAQADGSVPNGTEVLISCEPGYALQDPELRFLQCKQGEWLPSPGVPTCLPKKCTLPARDHAFFMYINEIYVAHATQYSLFADAPTQQDFVSANVEIRHAYGAQMFCLKEYELQGNDVLECNLGQWIKPAGICVPKSCPLPFLRYGQYAMQQLAENVTHGEMIQFNCSNDMYPHPAAGEAYCWYGHFRPDTPMCQKEKSRSLPQQKGTLLFAGGCERPANVENSWIYKETVLDGKERLKTLIDPEQSMFPNNTVIHYKCGEEYFGETSDPNSFDRKANSLQADAIHCLNGDWISLLLPCAPTDRPPADVHSNSSFNRKLQSQGVTIEACKPPALPRNVVVLDSRPFNFSSVKGYPHGSKLQVKCINDPADMSWSIKCKRGRWKKLQFIDCESFSHQQTCKLRPANFSHVAFFDYGRGLPLSTFEESFEPGSSVTARCEHEGLFKFSGSRELRCVGPHWFGMQPSCQPLSLLWKYTPAITYQAENGDISLTPSGRLFARKGSTIHLDCLLPRKKGQPEWRATNSYRQYPTIWTETMLQQLELSPNHVEFSQIVEAFRLSVYSARPEDTGGFTCITPSAQMHTVYLNVSDIDCSFLHLKPNMKADYLQADRKLWVNSVVQLYCDNGYNLKGTARLYCLESGTWSNELPDCEPISCPQFALEHFALQVNASGKHFGDHGVFSCSSGFTLTGPRVTYCLETGIWSDSAPSCTAVSCAIPDVPAGISVEPKKRHFSRGDVVKYKCAAGYILQGSSVAYCNDVGQWSHTAPECFKVCQQPTIRPNTRLNTRLKHYYYVGEKIVYYCTDSQNQKLIGNPVLECLAAGWSALSPKCESVA